MLQRDGGSPERAGIEEPANKRASVDAPSNSRDGSAQNNARLKYSFPTQLIILALVAVLIIPGIAFAGLLLARYAHSERARYELEGVAVARASASVLDRHLNGLQTTLQTLSTSAFLAAGDLEGFYRQAARVKTFIGADIGLRRPDGQQIVNTRVPWGGALPPTPLTIDAQVIATGAPVISDVFTGAIANRPLVAIILPVLAADEIKYLLHISVETDRFHDVLRSVVPANWLVGVGDRKGTYVTRSENHGEFTGKPGIPAFLARASAHEGTFVGENAFGERVLVGYTHSALSNWLIAANIKQSLLEAPLTKALYVLVTFGALTLLIASMIALWLWRFVARPLEGLAIASRQIGQMQGPIPVKTSLQEFVSVRDALSAAAEQVRSHNDLLEAKVAERTRELAQANAELTAQMAAREKAESQLRQMQKMEAVGQLTGGIAHDFNNMLSIVISSLNLLQRRLDRGQTDIQRFVASAMEGANRAASLTNRLLAFSRQQPLAPEVLDANQLVAGMSELLQRTLGEAIKIETVLAAGLWKTYADAAQTENAILNLALNARDAMPEGGRLTIETANALLDEEYAATNDGTSPGQHVNISVSDTGVGMSAEVASSAFDPFFTTKKFGLGTGLGLSQVYGFVKQSNGHIKIYSEPDHGTTIKIYLPRYYGEETPKPVRRDMRPLLAGSAHEVILVVEDEDKLRHLAVDTLTELGYTVLAAGCAKDALELMEKHPEISLLFTDIVMPDMGGRKLADEALKRRPDMRVLYTTGFTRNAVVHNGVLDAGVNFIAKPFAMEELSAKVREALSNPTR
jgi:signal transduction histidine kinase/ActR/RegA family two-component response regulator